ncbi:hypothetical protein SISNIDRAFT_134174 [Sistotremastrum niveocremeum HHB9708]|uniref:F-box domain-containing protein n=1 Tax=Sistotremastrum niveocremeum HHB9708 TaxID=1314777 RepID=A0A164ZWP1_9AGAM|nr:hypothetical protein SISNIDRAFT_134174 [Sistotremastrum niveocremeum HHB9708]
MCIARLPVELLLTIFDGLPLGDILWLSRTCKALRRVVFENRTAWKNASDVRRLPLPQGYTIDTVALYQLPLLAARAVSLSKKFTSWQSVFPKRVKSYPRMRTDVLPAFRGAAEPRLLPGARWFFTMEDRGLMLRPIIGIGTYMLNTTGRILSYQWKAAEGATSILVVTLSNRLEQDYMVARYSYLTHEQQCIDYRSDILNISGSRSISHQGARELRWREQKASSSRKLLRQSTFPASRIR